MARLRSSLLPIAGGVFGLAVALLVWGEHNPAAQAPDPFRNPALPVEQRVDSILAAMTLDEKLAALETDTSVARLKIPNMGASEGLRDSQTHAWRVEPGSVRVSIGSWSSLIRLSKVLAVE